jgi:hypothetical protein
MDTEMEGGEERRWRELAQRIAALPPDVVAAIERIVFYSESGIE